MLAELTTLLTSLWWSVSFSAWFEGWGLSSLRLWALLCMRLPCLPAQVPTSPGSSHPHTWEPAVQLGPCPPWHWETTGGPYQSTQAVNSEDPHWRPFHIENTQPQGQHAELVILWNVLICDFIWLLSPGDIEHIPHKLDKGGLQAWLGFIHHFGRNAVLKIRNKNKFYYPLPPKSGAWSCFPGKVSFSSIASCTLRSPKVAPTLRDFHGVVIFHKEHEGLTVCFPK